MLLESRSLETTCSFHGRKVFFRVELKKKNLSRSFLPYHFLPFYFSREIINFSFDFQPAPFVPLNSRWNLKKCSLKWASVEPAWNKDFFMKRRVRSTWKISTSSILSRTFRSCSPRIYTRDHTYKTYKAL